MKKIFQGTWELFIFMQYVLLAKLDRRVFPREKGFRNVSIELSICSFVNLSKIYEYTALYLILNIVHDGCIMT